MSTNTYSGAILAGGQSERMGRQDKGLLLYRGQPMVSRVAVSVEPLVESLFVNANRSLKEYTALGFDVIEDSQSVSEKGPLSGILASLSNVTCSTHLLISPCDTPCISQQALFALQEASNRFPKSIHFLSTSSGDHPLHAVLPVESALKSLMHFFKESERYSVMAFYEAFGYQKVFWEKEEELLNVNTLDLLS